jgi:alpha-acetolactate decarboxylase
MATAKQIAANKRNGLESARPQSPEIKQKVAQNRLKHGLSGGTFKVIEGEMQDMFEEFLQGLIRAYQLRREHAAQHCQNRQQEQHNLTTAIKNERLLQEQFRTAREAVAFDDLKALHRAA